MSLGGSGTKPSTGSGCSTRDAYHDAICRSVQAGVTYVVATCRTDADDTFASFSNYGTRST